MLPTENLPADRSPERQRQDALVEMLYLLLSIGLYVAAFLVPLLGIVLGIVFLAAGRVEPTRRTGRVLLILGIVNTVVIVSLSAMIAALGGMAGRLPLLLWEGM
jgi:hypothetical protein